MRDKILYVVFMCVMMIIGLYVGGCITPPTTTTSTTTVTTTIKTTSTTVLGSISGEVSEGIISSRGEVEVFVFQNGKAVKSLTVDPSIRRYTIPSLPEGEYGLAFKTKKITYAYDDLTENIIINSSQGLVDRTINLDTEKYNYRQDMIVVGFKFNTSKGEIEKIVNKYGCHIIEEVEHIGLPSLESYWIEIPENKIVFETIRVFESDPYVTYTTALRLFPVDENISSCGHDIDCVSAPDYDRPSCKISGGRATAINKMYGKYWVDKIRDERHGVSGLLYPSRHRSCYSIPKCVNNTCILVDWCEKDSDCMLAQVPSIIKTTLKCINNRCQ